MNVTGIELQEDSVKMALVQLENGVIQSIVCEDNFLGRIVTGMGPEDVVLRTLSIPLKGTARVLAALPFQLETLLPFAVSQMVVCPFLKARAQTTDVLLLATSKDLLEKHLEECNALKSPVDQVSCVPSALYRIARFLCPEEKDLLLFYVRKEKMVCIAIQENELVNYCSLPAGRLELERLSVYWREKACMQKETPWLLLGDVRPHETMWQEIFLSRRAAFSLPGYLSIDELHSHCLPIGYALDGCARDGRATQFRQKQFAPQHHLRARKTKRHIYIGACAALSIALSLFGHVLVQNKTKALREKFCAHTPSLKGDLSLQEMKEELEKWESSLRKQQDPTACLALTAPKVSEVLAWLSVHQSLVDVQGIVKEGLDIKSLHYQLVKFPHLDAPSQNYQAELEIEFTAKTPRLAREFHEAVLKGDRIINAKKEIKWNAQGNLYSLRCELNSGRGI